MFDMHMIGSYISFLRKKNKMTQSQLAEGLGVSHQAVSNWERGEAMPDISLLQTIATILATTVDRILASGQTGEEQPGIVKGDDQDTEKGNKTSIDNITGINTHNDYEWALVPDNNSGHTEAYMLKSSIRSGDDVEQPQPETPTIPRKKHMTDIDFEKLIRLAPFASEETLDKVIRAVIERSRDEASIGINLSRIRGLAPFLSEESLDLLVRHLCDKSDWDVILSLAPHLGEETLCRLVEGIDMKANFDIIKSLAPHLSGEMLDKLADQLDGIYDYNKIAALAPFLSDESLDKLIMSVL